MICGNDVGIENLPRIAASLNYDAAMRRISLVLFDMHDVLCRYDRDFRIAELAALSRRPESEIYNKIWASGFEAESDSGGLDACAYLAGFGERLGYPITLQEWLDNRKAATTPMPETLAIMAELRCDTAVLTNNHTLVRDHLADLFPELFALCGAKSYVSAQFGAAKPDPAVYRKCVAAAGATPAETLFIDDSAANVDGAIKAGLAGHVFTGAAALRAALAGYGLITP
jgi:putative hydrolase of the HAD superfamily